jgi:CubicO group peptidase (beta-lactamase class C family)
VLALICLLGQRRAECQRTTTDIRAVLDGHMRPDEEVRAFERSERLYPYRRVLRGKATQRLSYRESRLKSISFESDGRRYDLFDYLAQDRVAGLLVLKDGKIVLEDYELGLTPHARWASWSMAKAVSSTLIGAALQQRLIRSLDDPVSAYVPALRGSDYDAVSLRNVLTMSSGIGWSETYTDPNSECRRLTDAQLSHQPGASMRFMAGLERVSAPGSVWNYNSGEANIAGAVLEGATHKPLATYLSETLWAPLGMEREATWWTESPGGMGLSGVGLGATLRDYARFGLFVLNDGVVAGRRIVPPGWFLQAGSPQLIGGKSVDYGYFWWPVPAGDPMEAGAFQALGIFGQHLLINPREHLVIVVLSARSKPTGASPIKDLDFLSAVTRQLHSR